LLNKGRRVVVFSLLVLMGILLMLLMLFSDQN